jgi:hypothetical protein
MPTPIKRAASACNFPQESVHGPQRWRWPVRSPEGRCFTGGKIKNAYILFIG